MFNYIPKINGLLVFLTVFSLNFAQVTEEWRATYFGPDGSDFLSSMCIDGYGNVYVTGDSRRTANIYDYATVKYNTVGVQQWVARYNWPGITFSGSAYPTSIAVDNDGNAYVTGLAPVANSGNPGKITTVKYNLTGIQQWVAIYYDEFYSAWPVGRPSISVSNSSNIYVTGSTYFILSGYNYTTIKYNSAGAQQWAAFYHGPGTQYTAVNQTNGIKLDNLENVYVTGVSTGDTTYNDIATVKYNSSGIQQWAVRYNGPVNWDDSATAMAIDNASNVYVTGRSWGGDASGYDYITIKYNSIGVQQWEARYTSQGNNKDFAESIAVDGQGNVYVTGETRNTGLDCSTIKYNSSGAQQWVKIYDNGGPDEGVALVLDNSGNVYVTAVSYEGIRAHFATIKYLPSGVQEWVVRTNSVNGETPVANAVDSMGNVYVSGSPPYLTIKYHQLTGITPQSNEISTVYSLSQNYPNPFNPVTYVHFTIPKDGNVSFKVYNMLGEEMVVYMNGFLKAGSYNAEIEANNWASGTYFYTLTAGDYTESKKMILVK